MSTLPPPFTEFYVPQWKSTCIGQYNSKSYYIKKANTSMQDQFHISELITFMNGTNSYQYQHGNYIIYFEKPDNNVSVEDYLINVLSNQILQVSSTEISETLFERGYIVDDIFTSFKYVVSKDVDYKQMRMLIAIDLVVNNITIEKVDKDEILSLIDNISTYNRVNTKKDIHFGSYLKFENHRCGHRCKQFCKFKINAQVDKEYISSIQQRDISYRIAYYHDENTRIHLRVPDDVTDVRKYIKEKIKDDIYVCKRDMRYGMLNFDYSLRNAPVHKGKIEGDATMDEILQKVVDTFFDRGNDYCIEIFCNKTPHYNW